MSKIDNMLKEYDTLRDEISKKTEIHNSLLTFMITTVVAILAVAMTQNIPFLYLFPFFIIIPISMRVAYYRSMMVKLSAYIIVNIEKEIAGLDWETTNAKMMSSKKECLFNVITASHYYEGMLLGIACYILYIVEYMKNRDLNCITILNIMIPIVFLIWEGVITKRIASFDTERNKWISKWTDLKENDI